MKFAKAALAAIIGTLCFQAVATADPEEDRIAFVGYFQSHFEDIPFQEFANGIYAIDSDARAQWEFIESFPPYEFSVDRGKQLWEASLPSGSSYADCFGADAEDIRPMYPRFDEQRGEVATLELAINDCRTQNGAESWDYGSTDIIDLAAYLAYVARGKPVAVEIPPDSPGAVAAYEAGKRFYYSKRGQLNFACADCHVTSVGLRVRADRLSPSLGHATHFPVYRSKLSGMISLQQRFMGCVRDVRARPFALQSEEYRNLEYFLTYMSNGLEFNGPAVRK